MHGNFKAAAGLSDSDKLAILKTPDKGLHFFYICETREGGFIATAAGAHYLKKHGDQDFIVDIEGKGYSKEEAAADLFDKLIEWSGRTDVDVVVNHYGVNAFLHSDPDNPEAGFIISDWSKGAIRKHSEKSKGSPKQNRQP